YVEQRRGELRNDVGGGAAARDDAVDARLGTDLLPQHADVVERLNHRVERVDALPRVGRRVRGLARELEAGAHDAEQILVHDPAIEAVDHHRGVHVLEDAAPDELDLAAAALLGGRADDLDATLRQPVPDGGERRARAGAGGGDDVVAARVTDAGQSVVLAENRDRRSFTQVERAAERGVHAGQSALDLESLLVEELDEPRGSLDFLEAELRVVMDLTREFLEIGGKAVDSGSDEIFHGAHGRVSRGIDSAAARDRRQLYTGGPACRGGPAGDKAMGKVFPINV